MGARLKAVWISVRYSLWLLPAGMTVAAVVLAVTLIEAEQRGLVGTDDLPAWVFQGGVDGARAVLSTVAGSLVTVTGVIFSVTIVALQLASSQYTPRVLRNFTADRRNQVVLAVFIATFAYSLVVLRTIRSDAGDTDTFIPRLAVNLAVLFAIVCIGFLIFFVNHSARSIQVTTILDRVAKETLRNVERLFPEQVGRPDPGQRHDPTRSESSLTIRADRAGYLQVVDQDRLFDLGRQRELVIAMEPRIGEYVVCGGALASVSPAEVLAAGIAETIRGAFVLGPERTPEEDVEFGLVEISDIAIKALSPGINDPTTAIRCIDRISDILVALGTRGPPEPRRTKGGAVHFLARYTTFERAVSVAFDQIRFFGASNPLIAGRLLEVINELLAIVPPHRRAPLLRQARSTLRTARKEICDPEDLREVERAAGALARLHRAAAQPGAPAGRRSDGSRAPGAS